MGRPDYTLGAEYRRQQGVNGKSNSLGFFVSAPLPFFDRNQGEVARAAVEARQAGLRIEAVQAAVRAEVEEAWQQHRTAVALLDRIEREMPWRSAGLPLPAGYRIESGGQFENLARATRRFGFIVPITIALMFGLLFLAFESTADAALVLLNVRSRWLAASRRCSSAT